MKFLRITFTILFSLVIVAALAVAGLTIPVVFQGNWNIAVSNNQDMSPTIDKGALVISEKVNTNTIKAGDIIVLNAAGQPQLATISRVVSVTKTEPNTFYQIQGDNNALPDEWSYKASPTTFKYLFAVPIIGYLMLPLMNMTGAILFVSIIILLALIYRFVFFKQREVPEEQLWDRSNGIEEVTQIFADAGVELKIRVKKTRAEKKAARQEAKETKLAAKLEKKPKAEASA